MQFEMQKIIRIKYYILTVMSGLLLPLILLPVVKLFGYSEIVEEVAKGLIIFFLIFRLQTKKHKILSGVLFGFLFGLSESFFYLNNIWQLGDMSIFWQRIYLTLPIHILTCLIMVLCGLKNKKLILVGWVLAILLHLGFNFVMINK
jgi:hypothetical protein